MIDITRRAFSGLAASAAAALLLASGPALARGPAPDPLTKDFQRVVDAAYAKYKDLQEGKDAA